MTAQTNLYFTIVFFPPYWQKKSNKTPFSILFPQLLSYMPVPDSTAFRHVQLFTLWPLAFFSLIFILFFNHNDIKKNTGLPLIYILLLP